MIYNFILKTTLATGIILTLFSNLPTVAQEISIDGSCKKNQQLNKYDKFTVFYKSEFQSKGKTYWFYSAQYQDGAAINCVSEPGFKQPRPLNELKAIQNHFIQKITKDPRNKTAFLITVRGGNGSYALMTQYRLNLSIPSNPRLTKLHTWTSNN